VLIYVTFADEICVYHNFKHIDSVACSSLITLLKPEIEQLGLALHHTHEEYQALIDSVLSDSAIDEKEIEDLIQKQLAQVSQLQGAYRQAQFGASGRSPEGVVPPADMT